LLPYLTFYVPQSSLAMICFLAYISLPTNQLPNCRIKHIANSSGKRGIDEREIRYLQIYGGR
ncbi:MAG: hypothetical protein PHV61_08330, partial [Limnochordia bacterium]|nr:hypothetical protein [Limnochordia bacterium]